MSILPGGPGPADFLAGVEKEIAKSLRRVMKECVGQIKTTNGDFSHFNLKDYPTQVLATVYLISLTKQLDEAAQTHKMNDASL